MPKGDWIVEKEDLLHYQNHQKTTIYLKRNDYENRYF